MNKSTTTHGIILARHDSGDTDRVVTILTKDLGKISAIAKGVKKLSSKKAGHLEVGNVIEFELTPGKTLFMVGAAKTVAYHKFLQIENMRQLFVWLEILNTLVHAEEKDTALFDIARRGLDGAERYRRDQLQVVWPEIALYNHLGYQLELGQCVVGREPLAATQNYLQVRLGGVVCASHAGQETGLSAISSTAIKLFRLVKEGRWDIIPKLTINEDIVREMTELVATWRDEVVGHRLKSERF